MGRAATNQASREQKALAKQASTRAYNWAIEQFKKGHTWETVISEVGRTLIHGDKVRLQGAADAMGVQRKTRYVNGQTPLSDEEMVRRHGILLDAANKIGISMSSIPALVKRLKDRGFDVSADARGVSMVNGQIVTDSGFTQREMERVDV